MCINAVVDLKLPIDIYIICVYSTSGPWLWRTLWRSQTRLHLYICLCLFCIHSHHLAVCIKHLCDCVCPHTLSTLNCTVAASAATLLCVNCVCVRTREYMCLCVWLAFHSVREYAAVFSVHRWFHWLTVGYLSWGHRCRVGHSRGHWFADLIIISSFLLLFYIRIWILVFVCSCKFLKLNVDIHFNLYLLVKTKQKVE